MKLPNNIADFGVIRKEKYLYIDKTGYISELERIGRYLFFIRPRRFGKSLFLSMLEHYYDIEREDEFLELFGGLQVGAHPTSLKNSFLILKMNFSGLDTTTHEGLRESFDDRVRGSLVRFFKYYRSYFSKVDEIIEELKKASSTKRMEILFNEVAESGHKIFLIIDEYDHFANDIIAMGDGQYYRDIVRASGFVRDFYETIKIGTQGIIDRIFMTGITPIMLDDLTSGFNITTNITMIPTINEMLGFTGGELESILGEIPQVREQKQTIEELRVYYNGYKFNAKAPERVYNPHMVLYFLQQWIITGEYPEQLVDDNVKTDYGRLNRLIANDKNQGMLDKIIKEEGIVTDLVSRFSFDQMYDREYFVSLLFYMGLLTIQGSSYGMTRLGVPNYVIKTVYWEYTRLASSQRASTT